MGLCLLCSLSALMALLFASPHLYCLMGLNTRSILLVKKMNHPTALF